MYVPWYLGLSRKLIPHRPRFWLDQTQHCIHQRCCNRRILPTSLSCVPATVRVDLNFIKVIVWSVTRLVNHLVTPLHQHRRDGLKHLGPIIAARRKDREERGDDYLEKPVSFVFDLRNILVYHSTPGRFAHLAHGRSSGRWRARRISREADSWHKFCFSPHDIHGEVHTTVILCAT